MFTDRFLNVKAIHSDEDGNGIIIRLRLNPFSIEGYTEDYVSFTDQAGVEVEAASTFVYTKFGEFQILEHIDDFEKLLNDR